MEKNNINIEETSYSTQELRTSSNNMMCVVTYEPLSEEEQKAVEEILKIAN